MDAHQAAVETYRYLRVGIVALAVLLAASVAGQIINDNGQLLGSISAYYFTPVRDVFVGVLFALGLGLIVIRGRGIEDALLNLAGMLATIVAVVPTSTSVEGSTGFYAPLDQLTHRNHNAVWSLLVLGALAMAFAAATAVRHTGEARVRAVRGVTASAGLVVAFGLWLAVSQHSFDRTAHYVAAVGMFGIFVVVARLNAASARDAAEGPVVDMLPAPRRRAGYRIISWSMLGTVSVAGLLGLLQFADHIPIPHWLFWVEATLLMLFAAFWALQTVEYWHDGVPLD